MENKIWMEKCISEIEADCEFATCKMSEYAEIINRLEAERDMLKAAIATPELYVGIVAEVLAEERELAIAENLKLRARIKRLVKALKEISVWNAKDEKDYEIVLSQWRGCVAIAEEALVETKGVK